MNIQIQLCISCICQNAMVHCGNMCAPEDKIRLIGALVQLWVVRHHEAFLLHYATRKRMFASFTPDISVLEWSFYRCIY